MKADLVPGKQNYVLKILSGQLSVNKFFINL